MRVPDGWDDVVDSLAGVLVEPDSADDWNDDRLADVLPNPVDIRART